MCICYSHLCVSCSVMSDCVTPSTVACQAPLSMEVSRQEYWSVYPFFYSRGSSQLRDQTWVTCIAGRLFTISATREDLYISNVTINKNTKECI